MEVITKICTSCEKELEITRFGLQKRQGKPPGRRAVCDKCRAAAAKDYYYDTRDDRLAYAKAAHSTDTYKAYRRAYKEAHKERDYPNSRVSKTSYARRQRQGLTDKYVAGEIARITSLPKKYVLQCAGLIDLFRAYLQLKRTIEQKSGFECTALPMSKVTSAAS